MAYKPQEVIVVVAYGHQITVYDDLRDAIANAPLGARIENRPVITHAIHDLVTD